MDIVLEKIIKALYIKNNNELNAPKSHDLLFLTEKAKINVPENKKDLLDLITTFNIATRYPDYKQSFYKKCTKDYTIERINEIKEIRKWLKTLL